MFVSGLQTEIFETVYFELCIYHFRRHTIDCSSVFTKFLKKKQRFRFFCRFFLVKLSKSQSLKLNISRTAWPILMILVSFCRILDGLSDEINLFWRCSSPLRIIVNSTIFHKVQQEIRAIIQIMTRGGHFHINLYGTCRFSGYHFSA